MTVLCSEYPDEAFEFTEDYADAWWKVRLQETIDVQTYTDLDDINKYAAVLKFPHTKRSILHNWNMVVTDLKRKQFNSFFIDSMKYLAGSYVHARVISTIVNACWDRKTIVDLVLYFVAEMGKV